MICRDMRAIIKNVEHEGSENKYIVAKAVADDNMLWYYGRYATVERAMEVAKEITYEEVVGVVLFEEDTFAKMKAIEQYINLTEDTIAKKPNDFKTYYAAKETGFDCIRKVVKGE